jgi:hypothetical protein
MCRECGSLNKVTIEYGQVRRTDYEGKIRVDQVIDSQIQTYVAEASGCLQDAIISLNGGANRAATVMARAALEVTLVYAGFATGDLYTKIDRAVTAGALTQHDKEQAESVRLIGNSGAHPLGASYVPGDGPVDPAIAEAQIRFASTLIKKLIAWNKARLGIP